MADAFHAIWGLWSYNFVKIEIQILDVSIFWYTNIACYRSHLFHQTSHYKKKVRDICLTLKMGPWVTFRISFWIGFQRFFVFVFAQKKIPKPTGTHFWYGDRHRVTWCAEFVLTKAKYVEDNLGLLWKVKKSNVFFLRPPLFLTWINKRKLGYFVFEQKIWNVLRSCYQEVSPN